MSGGGGDAPPHSPPLNGGEFLLQLLRQPPQQPQTAPSHQLQPPPTQALPRDPAVAAVGPTLTFTPFPSNGHDLPYRHPPPWSHSPPPHFAPHNFFVQGFPQNPNHNWSSQPAVPGFSHTQQHNLQFNPNPNLLGTNPKPNSAPPPPPQQEQNLMFGSLLCEIPNKKGVSNVNSYDNLSTGAKVEGLSSKDREMGLGKRRLNGLEVEFQNSIDFNRNPQVNSQSFCNREQQRGGSGGISLGTQQHSRSRVAPEGPQVRQSPPGFSSKPSGVGNTRSSFDQGLDKGKGKFGQLNHRFIASNDEKVAERVVLDCPSVFVDSDFVDYGKSKFHQLNLDHSCVASNDEKVTERVVLDCPSVFADVEIDESLLKIHDVDGKKMGNWRVHKISRGGGRGQSELNDLDKHPVLEDGSNEINVKGKQHSSRDKDYRSDKRGQWLLGQRMRNLKRQIECRSDINRLNAPFLAIYGSLIPPEEEKAKQKQLLTLLERHVTKEWPEARLYLYGSCANSFGFSKSDIDVCLTIPDADINKSEVLLKLADILQSENLEKVQALTRARVPIVKLMDPATEISCDICINNVLAVVNTKLLQDYAQIDVRLRQLAFIVKHWAKSRGVNETYQGTLSSYAYVVMCIHFLQQRRPAILPCLQEMERTYAVIVDNIECSYFDQVEKLCGFGSPNRESIAQLVWGFFNYWAYCHDYAADVISIRTGSTLSKRAKDWTRRIGYDRHLICIEDPFEVSHDLGRVVDKYSIRVLREEFERAAEIMQCDPDPCGLLFKPYVSS